MPVSLTDAELRGYHASNSSSLRSNADYIIPGTDIRSLDIDERAADRKDSAQIEIDNRGGQYTQNITHGDRLEFFITPGEYTEGPEPSGYGLSYGTYYGPIPRGQWGSGPWGGGGWGTGTTTSESNHRWTGLVRPYSIDQEGGNRYTLNITGEDYVYGRLGFPKVYESFTERRISHSDGGILQTLLDRYPQTRPIEQSLLPDLDIRTDILRSGDDLIDVVIELAHRADCILGARGQALLFKPDSDLQSSFAVESRDRTQLRSSSNDDALINRWRMDGGKSSRVDDTQETVTAYRTVRGDQIEQFQIDHPKSEVAKVEIWTKLLDFSGDGLRVRLQKDDNGAPEDPQDRTKDLSKKFIPKEILEDDGWTTFAFGKNDTPGANPWILIQSDGPDGQRIGIDDSTGNIAFRAYYSYPVDVQADDGDSQTEYIRRDDRIKDDSVETFEAGEDAVRSKLRRTAEPTKQVETEAWSRRLHNTKPGEVVTFDHSETETVGHYVLAERSDDYEGGLLKTTCTFQRLPPDLAASVTPP